MPQPGFAVLCQAAVPHDGLFSILGAGATRVRAPSLPIPLPLTYVAQFYWAAEDLGQAHVVALRVEHPDGERIVDMTMPGHAPPPTEELLASMGARSQTLMLNLALQIRRPAEYLVRLYVDGEVLMQSPIDIASEMPPL